MESWGREVVPRWITWLRQSQSFKTFNNSHYVSCVAAPFLGKIHQNDEIYKDFENQNHTMSDEELYKADKLQKLAALGRYTILTFSICFVLTSFRLLSPPANEVCEGYVFTCVCHSVHGGGGVCLNACWDPPSGADTPPRSRPPAEQTPPEQTPAGNRHPLCAVHAGRYSQQEGGMHPTGMQSCWSNKFFLT